MIGSWSYGGNLGTARYALAGGGGPSAAICMGGYTNSNSKKTEEYNGTSWSSGGNLSNARRFLTGGGGPSAAICMGGHTDSNSNVTEVYIAETVGGGAIWM